MRKELLQGLTEEQIKKVESCKDSSEILALAKEEGMELTDEQLEAVSGGGCLNKTTKCPKCGSKKLNEREEDVPNVGTETGGNLNIFYKCRECGHKWRETHHYH